MPRKFSSLRKLLILKTIVSFGIPVVVLLFKKDTKLGDGKKMRSPSS